MNWFSKQRLSWLTFVGFTLFLMLASLFAYQNLPKSLPALLAEPLQLIEPSPYVLGTQDQPGWEVAQVKRIVDGDTVELIDGRKVRYIGVDTPETKDPFQEPQCFGLEASEQNKQLVEGKTVRLEKDVSETDRYGRLLRYVWVDDQLINLILVKNGFAFASSYPPDIAKQTEFRNAEREARAAGLGLWSSCPLN